MIFESIKKKTGIKKLKAQFILLLLIKRALVSDEKN